MGWVVALERQRSTRQEVIPACHEGLDIARTVAVYHNEGDLGMVCLCPQR